MVALRVNTVTVTTASAKMDMDHKVNIHISSA